MMKKTIMLWALIGSLLFTMFTPVLHAQASSANSMDSGSFQGFAMEDDYNDHLFDANFEADALGPIVPDSQKYQYNYNSAIFSSNIITAEDGSNALLMEEQPGAQNVIGSPYERVTNKFPAGASTQLNQAKIQINFKIEQNINAFISLLTYSTNDFNPMLRITKSGKLQYTDYDNGRKSYDFMNYELGEWYSLVMYVDAATGTYTLYCNDTLIEENLKWGAAAQNGIRHVRLTIAESSSSTVGAMYLDRLALSAKGEEEEMPGEEDFVQLKQKARQQLVGSSANDLSNEWIADHINQIASFGQHAWNNMNKDEHAHILFGNTGFPTVSSEMTAQYNQLSRMALAYGTYGSALYQNAALKDDILYGLEWLYENLYGQDEIDGIGWRSMHDFNWWDWMAGVPSHLNNILLIMQPEMDQTDIEKYLSPYLHVLSIMRKGQTPAEAASRVYYGTQAAILLHDTDLLHARLKDYDLMLTSVEDGPGVQEDWLYITHGNKPYSGTYGVTSLLDRLAVGYSLLAGSKFEVKSPHKYNLAKWMYYMFEPIMYKGGNMVSFGGRSFSRDSDEQDMGSQVIAAMLDLIGAYGLDDDERLKKIIKRHVSDDNLQDIIANLNINQLTRLKEVLEDHTIIADDYEIAYVYHTGDRVVQHRDNYAFGIAMSSSRVPTYESINQENKTGWYTGDGMTYLYLNNDLYQYGGDYRKNVNPYHLPGVTNDTQVRAALSIAQDYLPNQDFVGAAQLNNRYFTAAMAHEAYHNDVPPTGSHDNGGGKLPLHDSSLVSKKSWFAFDEEIVALGTGITANDGYEVATTVDNRRLIEVKERQSATTGEAAIPYLIKNVTAAGSDSNLPTNVIDGDYASRWSYAGLEDAWIQLELTESLPIGYLGIAVYNGQNSAALFEIKVSDDEQNWITVYNGKTSGTTYELEAFELDEEIEAKYVRLYGFGRETGSIWNSYTEIQVYPPDDDLPLILTNTSMFEAGAEAIIADGALLNLEDDSIMSLTDAEWVALENNAGYYFPSGGNLTIAKVGGATKFMELRLNHGVNPDKEQYAYVLLPHKNDIETAAYASNPDITILANTNQVQAVKDRSSGVTGMVFWEAGTFGNITVSEPMIVMIQEKNGQFDLSLSDPTQKLQSASVTINRSLELVKHDELLYVETEAQTSVQVDFVRSKGKTYTASFYEL